MPVLSPFHLSPNSCLLRCSPSEACAREVWPSGGFDPQHQALLLATRPLSRVRAVCPYLSVSLAPDSPFPRAFLGSVGRQLKSPLGEDERWLRERSISR